MKIKINYKTLKQTAINYLYILKKIDKNKINN